MRSVAERLIRGVCRVFCSAHATAHRTDVADGPDLHTAGARPRELTGDLHRLVDVFSLDQIEAAEHFLGFAERAVGDLGATIPNAYRLGRLSILQHLRFLQA